MEFFAVFCRINTNECVLWVCSTDIGVAAGVQRRDEGRVHLKCGAVRQVCQREYGYHV